MIRLNMIVEGQTEEAFVHAVLEEHLAALEVFVAVRCVETSRDKRRHRVYRGGLLDYRRARGDLHRWMKEDQAPETWFSTMFDLYALPEDFPNSDQARKISIAPERVASLEAAFAKDVPHPRFIPYIQLHEFEALLLADPAKFDWEFIENADAIARLVSMANAYVSPEEIDDDPNNAPSKRIIREIPEFQYRKASAGPVIASKIGLPTLRQKCPHFREWLERIENLAGTR